MTHVDLWFGLHDGAKPRHWAKWNERPLLRSVDPKQTDCFPPLITLMVGVGIPLSFLTLPVWWHLLSFL
jgi:hypothetical protein